VAEYQRELRLLDGIHVSPRRPVGCVDLEHGHDR
jgi:hypothetical protein